MNQLDRIMFAVVLSLGMGFACGLVLLMTFGDPNNATWSRSLMIAPVILFGIGTSITLQVWRKR